MNWFVEGMRKYAVFAGRAGRAEYWWFFLIYLLISVVLSVLDAVIGRFDLRSGVGPLSGLFYLVTLLPSVGVAVRRLHDGNRSGWWFLVLLLPLIGLLWFIVLMSRAGDPGPNRFGDAPAPQP